MRSAVAATLYFHMTVKLRLLITCPFRNSPSRRGVAAAGWLRLHGKAYARSQQPELQTHVATAFSVLTDEQMPRTWLIQSGCMPLLFAYIRNGAPDVRYLAARTILYMR